MVVSLKKQIDFISLKKKGCRLKEDFCFVVFRRNEKKFCRVALVFPCWTGSAVQRNLFKRWAREFFKNRWSKQGLDLLIGFEKRHKSFYKTITHEQFCVCFEKIYKRIKL